MSSKSGVSLVSGAPKRPHSPQPAQGDTRPTLLSMEAAAAELGGMSLRYVGKLIAQGDIRVIKIGRLVRIPRTELDRIAAEGIRGQ